MRLQYQGKQLPRYLPAAVITTTVNLLVQEILQVCEHILIEVAQEREQKISLNGNSLVFIVTMSAIVTDE